MKFLERHWWVIVALVALWWYANYRWNSPNLINPGSVPTDDAGGTQDGSN